MKTLLAVLVLCAASYAQILGPIINASSSGGGGGAVAPSQASGLSGFAFAAGTQTFSLTGVSSGQLLLVGGGWSATSTTASFSDNCTTGGGTNTWHTLDAQVTGSAGRGQHGWARVASTPSGGNCVVTVTQSAGTGSLGFNVAVWNDSGAGVDTSYLSCPTTITGSCQDAPGGSADAVGTNTTVTTSLNNDGIWAWTVDTGAGGCTLTAGTGYSLSNAVSTSFPNGAENKTLASAGTTSGRFTCTGTPQHTITGVIAIKSH